MKFRIVWPGRTKNRSISDLQDHYLRKIRRLGTCELVETREAKGLDEKQAEKIKKIEADGLEKKLKDDYIICLFDGGKEMTSEAFARFLEKTALNSPRRMAFVVGGFLGLDERILEQADLRLSLSKMTMSHELCRVVLLEQIYRALCIIKGRDYAK